MFRWGGLGVLVIALVLAACGRQVTGLGVNQNAVQAGKTLIRFRTAAVMDFAHFKYVIVFNTTGSGREPYTAAIQSGFIDWSFTFTIGGSSGFVCQPALLQYLVAPGGSSVTGFPISVPPQLGQVVPNTNGGQTGEFTLTFDRTLLFGINPGGTATPIPIGGVPQPLPTTAAQVNWTINLITTDLNNIPVDSLGPGGNQDNSLPPVIIDTAQVLDQTFTKPAGAATVTSPAAQITGYEIINNP
jgi:hypothetical protein